MIYFIRSNAHVKIGYARSVPNRIRTLRTANPENITVLGAMEGSRSEESELHQRFAKYRANGEWFILHRDIVQFIEENCRPALIDVKPTTFNIKSDIPASILTWAERLGKWFRKKPEKKKENELRSVPIDIKKVVMLTFPKVDVECYFKERIQQDDRSSVRALSLYDNYCEWCDTTQRQPVGLPIFSRQLTDLGVQKAKIGESICCIGIRMRSFSIDDGSEDVISIKERNHDK